MKALLIILTCFALEIAAFSKSNSESTGISNNTGVKRNSNEGCINVTITNDAPVGCGGWGIISKGQVYPSANIPEQFQENGITVCADYVVYEDERMCPCCGGTWANILSMVPANK
jgi:hypothetical protein